MMKRTLTICFLVLLALVSIANASDIKWVQDYPSAVAQAKVTGKLMMIAFNADWSEWCSRFSSDTLSAPLVVTKTASFVPLRFDADKDPDAVRLVAKFKLTSFPAVLFLDSDETVAYKVVGYESAKDFAYSLGRAATCRRDRARFKETLKATPDDFDALVGLACIEASSCDPASAASLVSLAARSAVGGARAHRLLDAYIAVGDGYRGEDQFERAIPFFLEAVESTDSSQTAYARVGIATCYAASGKLRQAKPYLEALMKMKGAPKEYVDQAKPILDAIIKAGS